MSLAASPLNIATAITLEGSVVRLEPIRREHAEMFWEVAKDALDDIFQWIPHRMKTREDFLSLVQKAFQEQERGESVVFATVEQSSGTSSQHSLHEYRPHQSPGGDRVHLDRARVAAHRRQHRSQIFDAESRVRSLEMLSRRTEDGCSESEVTERHPAHRRKKKKEPCAGT